MRKASCRRSSACARATARRTPTSSRRAAAEAVRARTLAPWYSEAADEFDFGNFHSVACCSADYSTRTAVRECEAMAASVGQAAVTWGAEST